MNSGTGPEHPPEGDARALLRRRHRRAAGGAVRRRPRAPGRASPWRRSTRPSSSAPTTRSSTTSACRRLNVVFAMDRAGLVGDDGPTHHGAFDIAYLRCLPNIVLMAPRDEAMLVHMLRTALAATTARSRCATRAARASGVPLPGRAARRSRSAPARSCARASAVALVGYGTGVAQGARGRRPARRAGPRRRRSPTPASPSRSTPGCSPSSPPSTTCSSPSRRACWPAASAPRSGSACPTAASPPAHHARRAARPLRDPRQARAPARGGRLHRRADRRAHRGRGARPPRLARRALNDEGPPPGRPFDVACPAAGEEGFSGPAAGRRFVCGTETTRPARSV